MDCKTLSDELASVHDDTDRGKKKGRVSMRTCGVTLLVISWSLWSLLGFGLRDLTVWREDLHPSGQLSGSSWRWKEIQPSKELKWHNCYEKYDCARLDLPLDWLDPSEDLKASIAIIRYNATDRKNYRGSIIINPGGPGGSGIWFVKRLAPYYRTVVGRNYDIVSFDPRGIGASTPLVQCLSSPQSNMIWDFQSTPVLDAHPGVLYDAYARAWAFSQACASSIDNNSTASGRFVGTTSTARDMLEISRVLRQDKLHYWGFSYGTYLGTVFASLFPNEVGRMVLDGNVDAVEYTSGRGTHFLEDTDKVFDSFHTTCHQAGSSRCSFYASTPSQIAERFSILLESVKKYPVIVPGSSAGERPEIISYSTLRHVISSSLYRPIVMFPLLSDALVALEGGNGLPFLKLSGTEFEDSALCSHAQILKGALVVQSGDRDDDPPGNVPPEDEDSEGNQDASIAIMCSDVGGWPEGATVEDFDAYLKILDGISKSAGATMATMALGCVGYNVKAKWRFTGPFEGNTSNPILFVANTFDNVTPLWSARRNSKGFLGSEILIQNATGHTTLSTPSKCTSHHIRTYFQTGKLPPTDTICEPDLQPFDDYEEKELGALGETAALNEALVRLMKAPVLRAGY